MKNLFEKIKNKIITYAKNFPKKTVQAFQIFLAHDMPLHAANAAFFFIITSIPLFMLLFSILSLVTAANIDVLIEKIDILWPNLPYVDKIVNYIFGIAEDLATKNIVSINIVMALITGSTTLYSFTIGIRKIHNISHGSNFLWLRIAAVINTFIFLVSIILMLLAFIMGSMILGYASKYLPVSTGAIKDFLSLRYSIAFIVLLVLLLSIYGTSTNNERKIKHNIVGAIIVALLWMIISNLFSFYFKTFPLNASIYGSLTGLVVILLWLFICMNIIFVGSCINEVFYPQKRILEEQKAMIIKEIEKGEDAKVDEIIKKRFKQYNLPKFNLPKLKDDNSYE